MNGQGISSWANKMKYIGSYVDDKKHGYGEFFWPDGRYYKGDWLKGKQHGLGVYLMDKFSKEKRGEW